MSSRLRPRVASWVSPLTFVCTILAFSVDLDAQDCDGDGTPDALELRPEATFGESLRLVVGDEPTTLAVGDFDGDDRPDLAVANTKSNSISVFLSRLASGGAPFGLHAEICAGIDPRGLDVGDVDGDGALDMVCGFEGRLSDVPGSEVARIIVLLGDGSGGFAPACDGPCDSVLAEECRASDFTALSRPVDAIRSVLLRDVDRDLDLDVVVGFRTERDEGVVGVLLGDGDGSFSEPHEVTISPLAESRYLAEGDFNENGASDLITAGGDLILDIAPDGLSPLVVSESLLRTSDFDQRDPKGVAVADFDGDDHLDIAFAFSTSTHRGPGGGSVGVLLGDGRGGFRSVPQLALDTLCDLVESIEAVDFDGDGDVDLVVTRFGRQAAGPCRRPGVQLLLGNGAGFFEPGPFVAFDERRPRWIAAADFDGDARVDLAVAVDDFARPRDEIGVLWNATHTPSDRNRNGIPDACEFVRGDVDGDGSVGLTDAIRLLGFLFRGGATPVCLESADADDDGEHNLSDAVRILVFLFGGASPLPPPSQTTNGACAPPTSWVDASGSFGCEVGC